METFLVFIVLSAVLALFFSLRNFLPNKKVVVAVKNDYTSTKTLISAVIAILIIFVLFLTIVNQIPVPSGIALLIFLSSLLIVLIMGIRDSTKNSRGGLYLEPFQIQILRLATALGIGQIIAFLLATIDSLGNTSSLSQTWFVIISFLIAIPFLMKDSKKVIVPIMHCGVGTFFGRRRNWLFFTEGEYTWYGEKLFFNISSQAIINPSTDVNNTYTTSGEKVGFVNLNRRTLSIWDDTNNKNIVSTLLSKTSTTVTTRLSIGIQTYDPMKWMEFLDPLKEIANRARASIREVVKNFIDVDVNPFEAYIRELLWGNTVICIPTLRDFELYREGSLVRDSGGLPIAVIVGKDDKGDEIEETEDEAIARLLTKTSKANPKLLDAATFLDKDGKFVIENGKPKINIYKHHLKETIGEIAKSTGSHLYMIAMSGTDVSESVKKATEKLSSEANEKASEERTALSIKNVMDILGQEVNPDLKAAIASNIANVPGISGTTVSGGGGKGDLGNKIIAAASQIGKK